jgi:hypothetical protein
MLNAAINLELRFFHPGAILELNQKGSASFVWQSDRSRNPR